MGSLHKNPQKLDLCGGRPYLDAARATVCGIAVAVFDLWNAYEEKLPGVIMNLYQSCQQGGSLHRTTAGRIPTKRIAKKK